jgi:hypothetical protein
MFLDKPFPYRTSYNIHTIAGIILGLVLGFILIVLEPFDNSSFQHPYRNALLAGYGLIVFGAYLVAHSIENIIFNKRKIWNWGKEITFQVLFGISTILLTYIYHEYIINERSFSFTIFLSFLFYFALPIFPLLVLPLVLLRYVLANNSLKESSRYNAQDILEEETKYIELKGDNVSDIVIVAHESLLFVKSVDNYVQIYYQDTTGIQNRILRSTLGSILVQADFLYQPHRSYLINPKQNFELKGNSQKASLSLKGFSDEIPVSRSSYSKIKLLLQSSPVG